MSPTCCGATGTVLDFGLASPTSALFDLATAIERNAVAWLELERGREAVRLDIALALLEGYRQVLPLSAARVHLLADLLPMVHFDFALSEVEYFEGITGSTANADVAWQPFMLGHPAWFHTARGRHCCRPCTPPRDPVGTPLGSDPFPAERDLTPEGRRLANPYHL